MIVKQTKRYVMVGKKNALMDFLVIAYVFLNVLPVSLPSGLGVRYPVLVGLVLLSLVFCPQYFFSAKTQKYTISSILIFILLMIYSIFYGNEMENILLFVTPLVTLFSIPAFRCCIEMYGLKRYLNAFSIACVIMIIVFGYIHYHAMNGNLLFIGHLSDTLNFIRVGKSDYGGRVVISTFVYMIPFSIIWMNRLKGVPFLIFSGFMFIIAAFSQTMGILIPIVLYFIYIQIKRKEWGVAIVTLAVCIYLYSISVGFIQEFLYIKSGSVDAKSTQMEELFKDFKDIEYVFGRGIGCLFHNFGGRDVNDPMIEVAIVQIVQMGGLLFSWLLVYVYLGPPLLTLKRNHNKKTSDLDSHVLCFSQLGYFMASLSNPYLWSAGGLFFNVLIEAYNSNGVRKKLLRTNKKEPELDK